MSKSVLCNKYHKIIELHIINILFFYNNNNKNNNEKKVNIFF